MLMKKVQLRFDSLLNLWCFKQKVQAPQVEINPNKHLLTAELSDNAIDVARREYKAEVLEISQLDNSFYNPLH
ncbi:MAG TPA: hypothetical protein VGB63_03235 [Pedobacter sp.]